MVVQAFAASCAVVKDREDPCTHAYGGMWASAGQHNHCIRCNTESGGLHRRGRQPVRQGGCRAWGPSRSRCSNCQWPCYTSGQKAPYDSCLVLCTASHLLSNSPFLSYPRREILSVASVTRDTFLACLTFLPDDHGSLASAVLFCTRNAEQQCVWW